MCWCCPVAALHAGCVWTMQSASAGSAVEEIVPINFLARCRKSRLNQAPRSRCLWSRVSLGPLWLRSVIFVLCLLVVLTMLSVVVLVIYWKDSSPKWPRTYRVTGLTGLKPFVSPDVEHRPCAVWELALQNRFFCFTCCYIYLLFCRLSSVSRQVASF